MIKWKKRLEDFVFKKDTDGNFVVDMRYMQGIVRTLAGRSFGNWKQGERKRYWEKMNEQIGRGKKGEEVARESFMNFIGAIAESIISKGYSSFFLPTIVGEKNLYFSGEEEPAEEIVWKILYLSYTSVKFGNALVNFDYISDEGRAIIWHILTTDRVIIENRTDMKPIKNRLNIKLRASKEFFNTFSLLAFLREKVREEVCEENERDIWFACRKKYGFNDMTSIIMMRRKQTKGEYYVFSYLSSLFQKWLDQRIVAFFDSFTNISGARREDVEHISEEREKLIFHLLKYKEIPGELLAKLTGLKIEHESGRERHYGIRNANFFFKNLRSNE
ncbi:MAG: hypothetical protein OCU24_00170 [Candidatus Methanospirare jalkutatii]|nr:hypothetical protein [Candidatus Methanospirare jalkutatii]